MVIFPPNKAIGALKMAINMTRGRECLRQWRFFVKFQEGQQCKICRLLHGKRCGSW